MTAAAIFGICAATLIGIGAFGLVTRAHLLGRIVAFNVLGSGVFLMFGALGNRDPASVADPVPQAIVITGIVVALAATALAVSLIIRLFEETGQATLPVRELDEDEDEAPSDDQAGGPDRE